MLLFRRIKKPPDPLRLILTSSTSLFRTHIDCFSVAFECFAQIRVVQHFLDPLVNPLFDPLLAAFRHSTTSLLVIITILCCSPLSRVSFQRAWFRLGLYSSILAPFIKDPNVNGLELVSSLYSFHYSGESRAFNAPWTIIKDPTTGALLGSPP